MDSSLQRRVQRYGWDKAASFYEAFWYRQLKPAQDLLLEMAALQAGEKILDIACGTGLVSFRAGGEAGGHGSVLGTDISEKMVEMASATASQKNLTNISFQRMDAEDLELPPASFDVALCALGLMYFPDPIKALKETWRVLRPGGWNAIFNIVDKRVSSEVCPMFFNLGNPSMLPMSMEAAGFTNIQTEIISTYLQYEDIEEACGAAFVGGPVALAYHKFEDSVKNEVHQEYLESISSFKKNEGYEVPGEFVVATGLKPG